jgi:hypothetical protein
MASAERCAQRAAFSSAFALIPRGFRSAPIPRHAPTMFSLDLCAQRFASDGEFTVEGCAAAHEPRRLTLQQFAERTLPRLRAPSDGSDRPTTGPICRSAYPDRGRRCAALRRIAYRCVVLCVCVCVCVCVLSLSGPPTVV